jgi:hypothetical protein
MLDDLRKLRDQTDRALAALEPRHSAPPAPARTPKRRQKPAAAPGSAPRRTATSPCRLAVAAACIARPPARAGPGRQSAPERRPSAPPRRPPSPSPRRPSLRRRPSAPATRRRTCPTPNARSGARWRTCRRTMRCARRHCLGKLPRPTPGGKLAALAWVYARTRRRADLRAAGPRRRSRRLLQSC